MTSNTVCVTGEIDNVDFTREDGASVTMLIPPDTPVGTRTIVIPQGYTLAEHRIIRQAIADALAVYTGTSGMSFEEVEPLWPKLNPDVKEQYRRLARLAITAARTEALK